MLDIDSFIISSRASWVKRNCDTTNNGKWKQIYENKLKRYIGNLIFECNTNVEDTKHVAEDNKFLNNIPRA